MVCFKLGIDLLVDIKVVLHSVIIDKNVRIFIMYLARLIFERVCF